MKNAVAECVLAEEPMKTLTVIFHACEDGGFTAECLEIPGCCSEGDTQEEAERNIRDAINGCLSIIFEDCLTALRSQVDLSTVDLRKVAKQESMTIDIPQLHTPAFA